MKLLKTTFAPVAAVIFGTAIASGSACSGSTPAPAADSDSGAASPSDSGATSTLPEASGDTSTVFGSGDASSSLLCQASSACADAGVCCLTSTGSACQASPCGTYQLCAQASDCPSGDNCQPVTGMSYGVCLGSGVDDGGSDSSEDAGEDTGTADAGDAGSGSDAGDAG